MKNFEKLKKLSLVEFAQFICFGQEGEDRATCTLCQRYYENNCDDRCYSGTIEYLEREV